MATARVLWLAKGLGRGGAERLLVDSTSHVDRERFHIEVAYLLPWKDAFVRDFESRGIRTHCLGNRHEFDPRWLFRLRRLVGERNYDVVHTHMPYPAIGARLALVPGGPAIVHTEHNTWDRLHRTTRWANAFTYRRNAAVLAVSQAVADSIRDPGSPRAGMRPVEVVVHGADLESVTGGAGARSRARASLGLDPDVPVVGTVGNLTPKKDHRTLLEAFALLSPEHPRMRLVVIGSGPSERQLEQEVRSLGLGSRVTFTGSRDDVFALLPAFDVFALSSRHEGLPIALLEAMATGLPCVVTRVGGVPEVLTNGEEGLMVPAGDPPALAASLRKLVEDPRLRAEMGTKAARRARQFDLARAVTKTQEIYESVLARR